MSSRKSRRILILALFVGVALLPYAGAAEARSRDGGISVLGVELSARTLLLDAVDFLRALVKHGPPPPPPNPGNQPPGHHSPEGTAGCPAGGPPPGQRG
jgi:hypothetical protein